MKPLLLFLPQPIRPAVTSLGWKPENWSGAARTKTKEEEPRESRSSAGEPSGSDSLIQGAQKGVSPALMERECIYRVSERVE